MSDAPALRQAALASSSSPGWALIGPGGSISFAGETDVAVLDVGDFPDSEAEDSGLGVFDGPEVHPAKTRDTTLRTAPMRKERGILCLQSPRRPAAIARSRERPGRHLSTVRELSRRLAANVVASFAASYHPGAEAKEIITTQSATRKTKCPWLVSTEFGTACIRLARHESVAGAVLR